MKLCLKTLLCLSVLCPGLFAQSVATSQIAGTVQDSTGLAIPGAEVKITQTETGAVRTAQSAADGGYVLPSLPIGHYRIEVTKAGFNTWIQNLPAVLTDPHDVILEMVCTVT